MKTSNNISNGNQMTNTLNETTVTTPVVKSAFSATDLWSIQRNRRVRTVRKVVFN